MKQPFSTIGRSNCSYDGALFFSLLFNFLQFSVVVSDAVDPSPQCDSKAWWDITFCFLISDAFALHLKKARLLTDATAILALHCSLLSLLSSCIVLCCRCCHPASRLVGHVLGLFAGGWKQCSALSVPWSACSRARRR